VRGDIEYDVNLKAEMQISNMHEKFDTMYSEVQKRLDRIEKRMPGGHAAGSVSPTPTA
jgi:uncharacterized membrane protein